jgi:hypothetical protein
MIPSYTYEEARPRINSGDLVFFFYDKPDWRAPLRSLIRFFTGSKFFHCAVAVWVKTPSDVDQLMLMETATKGGKRVVPLSIYHNFRAEVVPVPKAFSFGAMEEEGWKDIGKQRYGFLDLIGIALREYFGLPTKSIDSQVCSELSAAIWIAGGAPLVDTYVSPGRLKLDLELMGIPSAFEIQAE